VMVLLMVPQVLVNIFGVRLTARLNNVSVYWHIAGGAVIVLLLALAGRYHNDLAFLFRFVNSVNPFDASSAKLGGLSGGPCGPPNPPGGGCAAPALVFGQVKIPSPLFALAPGLVGVYRAAPFGLVFVLALLQAQWTYTGYDASAHMAEETRMARLNSAWGIFLSVAISAVVGYVLLVVLTWAIPRGDVAAVASDPYPVLAIADGNLSRPAANLVAVIIGGAMWLCGSSSVSSMARMWFAFARDGGMPGSRWIARVSPRSGAPVAAILVTSVLAVLVSLYAAAFTVLTSASTITLYLAYGIPIFLTLRNRLRRRGEFPTRETAPWSLGRKATPVNVVAVVWILFITVVFALPPNELVLWTTLLFALFLAGYWLLRARRHFRGPAGGQTSWNEPA
jgi:amino acid transporter